MNDKCLNFQTSSYYFLSEVLQNISLLLYCFLQVITSAFVFLTCQSFRLCINFFLNNIAKTWTSYQSIQMKFLSFFYTCITFFFAQCNLFYSPPSKSLSKILRRFISHVSSFLSLYKQFSAVLSVNLIKYKCLPSISKLLAVYSHFLTTALSFLM